MFARSRVCYTFVRCARSSCCSCLYEAHNIPDGTKMSSKVEGGTATGIPRIMVFRPTLEEMKDFSKYLEYVESQGAHKAGLAKIIPPKEWIPRKGGYDNINLVIPAPISQVVTGRLGLYQQYNIQKKSMTVKEFKKVAESEKYRTPVHFDYEDLERKYWKNVAYNPPIYGADVSGSLYDPGVEEFNINHLNTILDLVGQDYGIKIEGVNTAYLYFGMWKTTFAWHTEDMDLYSINYLHFGAPKSWYCVPPEHGRRLERLAAGFFHGTSQGCSAFLRHKMTVISPQILKQYSIPFSKITQEPGEFMITFPYGYHAGFNHGFNCAESTNFALPRWVEYGKRASRCMCRQDCVKISMDVFVKKFQPERYELWLAGKDIGFHPEDPSKATAAPPPTRLEMVMLARMDKPRASKRNPVAHGECTGATDEGANDSDGTVIYDLEEADVELEKKKKKVVPKRRASKGEKKKTKKKASLDSSGLSDASDSSAMVENAHGDPGSDLGPPMLEPMTEPPRQVSVTVSRLEEHLAGKSLQYSDSVHYVVTPPPCRDAPYARPAEQEGLPLNLCIGGSRGYSSSQEISCSRMAVHKLDPYEVVHSYGHNDEQTKNVLGGHGAKRICMGTAVRRQPVSGKPPPAIARVLAHSARGGTDTSDEDVPSGSTSRDPGMATWAAPYTDLWSFRPSNFYAERQFNRYCSTIEPHCSICTLFKPLKYTSTWLKPESVVIPDNSAVWMPAICFVNGGLDGSAGPHSGAAIADSVVEQSSLLVCSNCCVCVHAHCYGVTSEQTSPWKCDRCAAQQVSAECCLCSLRGGALKPTTHGRWVHLLCALLVPEVHFVNPTTRSPIDITLNLQRKRLKCFYCHKLRSLFSTGTLSEGGGCIQCTAGKCTTAFHVTCAHAAGVIFETYDWPVPVYITCTRHVGNKDKHATSRELPEVGVGARVVAKHKNGRYYWGRVTDIRSQDFYSVDFEDNSSSDNLLPQDIESRDCLKLGPPNPGDIVSVRWTDGKLYQAVFKRSTSNVLYTVTFEDLSERTSRRAEIYAESEDLPKKVKSSLQPPRCSTQASSKSALWRVVASELPPPVFTPTTSCSSEALPPPRCPPLHLKRDFTQTH
ncbi:lysine-specific demethylase 4C-like isoform X2 [Ornithodoros turicata]|uniref:lysine-specific demethylase 4C-like isoform X2 n=1 Tax=Ornithodoros turicata TaxID=34597 RepID=UPI00313A47E2